MLSRDNHGDGLSGPFWAYAAIGMFVLPTDVAN